MAFLRSSFGATVAFSVALCAVLVLAAVPSSLAQIPDITIDVGEIIVMPGDTDVHIPIYLSNMVDDIAGFNLWIQLDRPDIMRFPTVRDTSYDTTKYICIQWSGDDCIEQRLALPGETPDFINVDTFIVDYAEAIEVGTLSDGWSISPRSLSGNGTDILLTGMASLYEPEQVISAGQSGGILIYAVAEILPTVPDTLTDRVVTMMIQTVFKDHFGLSRPDGSSIGWVPTEVEDTLCYECLQWGPPPYDDSCMMPNRISYVVPELCEWIELDTVTVQALDTFAVKVYDGSAIALIPPPPVLDSIGDKRANIPEVFAFTVTASDPDETTPILTTSALPTGAVFTDNLDGTGDFEWTPQEGDVGIWDVTFYAHDEITMGVDSELVVLEVTNNPYICGDVDGVLPPRVDVADVVYLVKYMFNGGPAPTSEAATDMDCSGRVDVADLVYMARYMFNEGPELCPDC